MKRSIWIRLLHWISTGLLSIVLLLYAFLYVAYHDEAGFVFQELGFPIWLMYPLAVAKSSAVIVLLSKFDRMITKTAYAGVLLILVVASIAHFLSKDGQMLPALICIALLLISYVTWDKSDRELK